MRVSTTRRTIGVLIAALPSCHASAQPCDARWATGFHLPAQNGWISELLEWDDGRGLALYAAGSFSAIGAATYGSGLAFWRDQRWQGLGQGLASYFPGPGSEPIVEDVAVFDFGAGPRMYACGHFGFADGQPCRSIAAWDGQRWTPIPTDALSTPYEQLRIHAMTWYDDGDGPAVHVGGNFHRVNGVDSFAVAKWNGSAWLPAAPGLPIPQSQTVPFGDASQLVTFHDGTNTTLIAGVKRHGSNGWSRVYRRAGAGAWEILPDAPLGVMVALNSGPARGLYVYGDSVENGLQRFDGVSWTPVYSSFSPHAPKFAVPVDGQPPMLAVIRSTPPNYTHDVEIFNGDNWLRIGEDFGPSTSPNALHVARDGGGFRARVAVSAWGDADAPAVLRLGSPSWTPLSHAGLGIDAWSAAVFDDGDGESLFAMTYSRDLSGVLRLRSEDWQQVGGASGVDGADVSSSLRVLDTSVGPRLAAIGRLNVDSFSNTAAFAQWDGAAWTARGVLPNDRGSARAAAYFDFGAGPDLYLTGDFASIDGVDANHIARISPSGAVTPFGTGLNFPGAAMAVFDDGSGPRLVVGGAFTRINTTSAFGLASWDGSTWSAFPGFRGSVSSIVPAVINGVPTLFVGGSSIRINNVFFGYAAQYRNGVWSRLGVGNARPHAAIGDAPNQTLICIGALLGAGVNLSALNLGQVAVFDGSTWSGIGAFTDGLVTGVASDATSPSAPASIYLTGDFTRINDTASYHIGRIDLCSLTCPGDANNDRAIDMHDLNAVLTAYGQTTPPTGLLPAADLNADGVVNFLDLNLLLTHFGQSC